MEQNEIDNSFKLYDYLTSIVDEKKKNGIQIIKDIRTLYLTLSGQNIENAKIIYYIILHHFLIKENIDCLQLINKKIIFYGQKSMFGGKGVIFTSLNDNYLLEILHEFLNL